MVKIENIDLQKVKNRNGIILLGVVCAVLVFGICVQLKTIENASSIAGQTDTENKLRDQVLKWKERYDSEYAKLEEANKELELIRAKTTQNDSKSAGVEAELKAANQLLGLTELKGKGIIVTLDDNKTVGLDTVNITNYLVHDGDIMQMINELKNAGAEAISINGQRVVSQTAITCDGNVIRINNQKVGAPYVIQAIGQPEWLESALILPGGLIQFLNRDGVITKIEKSNNITIPKYTGVYNSNYIKNIE